MSMRVYSRAPLLAALLLPLILCVVPSFAATQGSVGPTSTGSIVINAVVASRVSISHLTDITFSDSDLGGPINTGGTASKNEDVCIWSNNSDRSYFVTATGSGIGGNFTIVNGNFPVIPYGVRWAGTAGQSNGTVLVSGIKSPQFTSAASLPDCGGGNSASLIVRIQGSDAATMQAASVYTGTLTLLITPS
jgi:hypothetical protein